MRLSAKVERHANFVTNAGPLGADIVGLPERGDLGKQIAFERV